MPAYRYDHVHLRSPDPEATARFFEQMFGGGGYTNNPEIRYAKSIMDYIKLGGQTVLIAPPHHDEPTGAAPRFPYFGLEHIGLTVDDIDAAVADLRAKGADIAVGPMDYSAGTRLAFIRGPEGVFVEIVQRR